MKICTFFTFLTFFLLPFYTALFGQTTEQMSIIPNQLQPPTAPVQPHPLIEFGDTRIDNYYWLNDRNNPQVIHYLQQENEYLKSALAHTESLQHSLYSEMVSRIPQQDMSVPYIRNGFYYYTRYETNKEYPIYARKIDTADAKEEILINCNINAAKHDYFSIGSIAIDSSNSIMAYSEDTLSRRIYTIRFKDLQSDLMLPDVLENTSGSMVWYNDGKAILYIVKDPNTLRSFKIFRHIIGQHQSEDTLIYEEKDDTYSVSLHKSRSGRFIYLNSSSTLTSEVLLCDADNSNAEFQVFEPRKKGHLYNVADDGQHFYIISNENAQNFKLFTTELSNTDRSHWIEKIPHRFNVLIEDIDCFKDFIVLSERIKGIVKYRIISGEQDCYLDFDEDSYMTYLVDNHQFNTRTLRYSYNSLTTPYSIYEYELDLKDNILLKESEVVGGYDKNLYQSERIEVTSRDGVKIPVSIVYKKDKKRPDGNPLLLYGYGSYGYSLDPSFSSVRLSLLDRGFVYAIAHIRGGQELGRQWYEDGKLLKKKNTFYDFIDCANYLINQKYTSPTQLYAMGGSAGGLLMGAIINMAPQLFHGVIAAVPFVDVLTTMLDESIPLTTGEFDEWGNPKIKEYYDYIKSYSPYDNVVNQSYPAMLVTTGLHDSQVQYWEPAKWVAKLRAVKKGGEALYLNTNMAVGHGGASGRFERYKEYALEYAFLLDLQGIKY